MDGSVPAVDEVNLIAELVYRRTRLRLRPRRSRLLRRWMCFCRLVGHWVLSGLDRW